MLIGICNRGPAESVVHVLPTLWFRNIWTWWPDERKPSLKDASGRNGGGAIAATDAQLGDYFLHCEGNARLLFTENETNNERLFGSSNPTPYVKDGINNYVVAGREDAVNPNHTGTKAAAHYQLRVGAGATSSSGCGSPMPHPVPRNRSAGGSRKSSRRGNTRPTSSIGR